MIIYLVNLSKYSKTSGRKECNLKIVCHLSSIFFIFSFSFCRIDILLLITSDTLVPWWWMKSVLRFSLTAERPCFSRIDCSCISNCSFSFFSRFISSAYSNKIIYRKILWTLIVTNIIINQLSVIFACRASAGVRAWQERNKVLLMFGSKKYIISNVSALYRALLSEYKTNLN